jgi:hypothetical protein
MESFATQEALCQAIQQRIQQRQAGWTKASLLQGINEASQAANLPLVTNRSVEGLLMVLAARMGDDDDFYRHFATRHNLWLDGYPPSDASQDADQGSSGSSGSSGSGDGESGGNSGDGESGGHSGDGESGIAEQDAEPRDATGDDDSDVEAARGGRRRGEGQTVRFDQSSLQGMSLSFARVRDWRDELVGPERSPPSLRHWH